MNENGGRRSDGRDRESGRAWIARILSERRGVFLAVPAAALGVLVIVAALNLDRGSARSTNTSRLDDAVDLLGGLRLPQPQLGVGKGAPAQAAGRPSARTSP
jgi:hypothetical protein